MAQVYKGKISSIALNTAAIIPDHAWIVTPGLIIPQYLVGTLSVNDQVAYVQFEDGTGLILSRMDGAGIPAPVSG